MNLELLIFDYFLKGQLNQNISINTMLVEILPGFKKFELKKALTNLIKSNIVVKLDNDEYMLSPDWYNLCNILIRPIWNISDSQYYTTDKMYYNTTYKTTPIDQPVFTNKTSTVENPHDIEFL